MSRGKYVALSRIYATRGFLRRKSPSSWWEMLCIRMCGSNCKCCILFLTASFKYWLQELNNSEC